MELMDPRGDQVERASEPAARPVLAGLDGKTIGLLDNSKPNFIVLLDEFAVLLAARFPTAKFERVRKPYNGLPVPDADRDRLLASCDAVLTGMGD